MIRKYLIANLIFEINFESDAIMEERLAPYSCDIDSKTDITINIGYTDRDIEVRRENIIKLSELTYYYNETDRDVMFYYDENISKAFAKVSFDKSYNNVDIMLYDLESECGVDSQFLMYNICGRALSCVMNMHGGFEFHSSSVAYDGYGVAFSALSGTGKSTHTKLWLDNFDGTYIINDDTPIISKTDDGSFVISGTPWAGSTGINAPVTLPLKAIVFLERAETNFIEPVTAEQAMAPLFEAFRVILSEEMLASVLSTLNELLLKVPAYRLKCNMDNEAAFVSRDGIWAGQNCQH